jgi:N-terminal domain of anti-restriction factor ArdC
LRSDDLARRYNVKEKAVGMLIASQKPNATHVAGFHAWHKLGRFVKKGEKGILILASIIRKKAENNGEAEPADPQLQSHFALPTCSI